MRREALLTLPGGRAVRLRELRVCDVWNLQGGGDVSDTEHFLSGGDWIEWAGGGDSPEGEAFPAEVWEAFSQLNAAIFKGGKAPQNPKAGFLILENNCLVLIERGHANVFDYGWSFFLSALKFANQ